MTQLKFFDLGTFSAAALAWLSLRHLVRHRVSPVLATMYCGAFHLLLCPGLEPLASVGPLPDRFVCLWDQHGVQTTNFTPAQFTMSMPCLLILQQLHMQRASVESVDVRGPESRHMGARSHFHYLDFLH